MRTVALWLAMAALFAGCVTVRSAPPSFSDAWPPSETGPRPAIELMVTGGAIEDGFPRDLGPILDLWGAATERAYRESALFSDVSLRPGRRDLRVRVELRANVHQIEALTFFSYLTFLVLPHVVTSDITATTTVTTGDGQPVSTIEVPGCSRTWYEILLFPFSPFWEPQRVTPEIVYDMNRQTITALHARGVF